MTVPKNESAVSLPPGVAASGRADSELVRRAHPEPPHAYRTPFDTVLHFAFVLGTVGDGRSVPARLHRADIVSDIFGAGSIDTVLQGFKRDGCGVLVYLRDGAAGVPANLAGAAPSGAEGERATQWREIGLGAQIDAATDSGRFPILLLATIMISLMVVTMNRLVWRRLYRLAETRYKLEG